MNRRELDQMTGMLSLREAMNRLLEDSFVSGGTMGGARALQMPLDLYETGDALVARASMPGVHPEDIDITATGDTLTLRGHLHDTTPSGEGVRHHQREHHSGSFARSLTLPVEIQPDKVEATFEHGVLTLTMPKAERLKPKSIKLGTRGGATPIETQAGGRDVPNTEYVSGEQEGAVGSAATQSAPAAPAAGPSDEGADGPSSPR